MFHVAGQNRPGVHCVISVNTGHCSPEIVRFTLKIVGYAGVYCSDYTQCWATRGVRGVEEEGWGGGRGIKSVK